VGEKGRGERKWGKGGAWRLVPVTWFLEVNASAVSCTEPGKACC